MAAPLTELLRSLPEYDQARQVLEEALMDKLANTHPALLQRLRTVFPDDDAVVVWLLTPDELDGRFPLELLETGELDTVGARLDETHR